MYSDDAVVELRESAVYVSGRGRCVSRELVVSAFRQDCDFVSETVVAFWRGARGYRGADLCQDSLDCFTCRGQIHTFGKGTGG